MKYIWLLLLLLILACEGTGGPEQIYTNEQFRHGVEGLSLEFTQNTPPKEVFENEQFLIAAELHNQGASNILDGFTLLSLEQDLIESVSAFGESFDLEGRSRANPDGGIKYLEYVVKAKPIALSKKQESIFSLIACYDYETKIQENICIDPRVRRLSVTPESCAVEDLVLADQGGPLAVTLIEVKPKLDAGGLRKIQFRIKIVHKGNGFFSLPVKASSLCTSEDIDDDIFNRVKLHGFLVEEPLECRRDGIVMLKDNVGEVICEVDAPLAERSYTAPLNLELKYGYSESISHKVVIERLK